MSSRQKAVLRYTDSFLGDARLPDAALQAEMKRHFRSTEIVELTAGIALFMGFSKIAIALGEAPESMPTTVVPTPDLPGSD